MSTILPTNEPIRALWWKQPYATLMLHGKIETRTWSTNYRGLVLICASQAPYTYNQVWSISKNLISHAEIRKQIPQVWTNLFFTPKLDVSNYPTGVAIAIGRLVDCRLMTLEDEDKTFVDYYQSQTFSEKPLWCHVYEDVQPVEPFWIPGKQGWYILPDDVKAKIKVIQPSLSA